MHRDARIFISYEKSMWELLLSYSAEGILLQQLQIRTNEGRYAREIFKFGIWIGTLSHLKPILCPPLHPITDGQVYPYEARRETVVRNCSINWTASPTLGPPRYTFTSTDQRTFACNEVLWEGYEVFRCTASRTLFVLALCTESEIRTYRFRGVCTAIH